MKKFIAAFDGLRFLESTMRYAIDLAKHANAHLVGVFLDDFTRRSYSIAEVVQQEMGEVDQYIKVLDERDDEQRLQSVVKFQAACREEGISFAIHRDENIALQDLLHESIYADLLIIGETESLTRFREKAPTRFIRELLNEVQCPVILAPEKYRHINKIILLYDGEPSSVHAVRTFSYLFEGLKQLDTEVLTVKREEDDVLLPNGPLIKEFIEQHYPEADAVILKGDPEFVISEYIKREKKFPMVVLGAYQRSRFSHVFKPSMADYLVQQVDVPLFIAHNKS